MLTLLERFKSPTTSIIRSDEGGYYKMVPGKQPERLTQQKALDIVEAELGWGDEKDYASHNID